MWPTSQPRFWPKNPVRKRQRQEHGRDDRQLLHLVVEPVDQGLVQVAGAVGHQGDEVVVVLDLRPLVELLRVLDRERVDLEHLAQQGDRVRARVFQVQPEQVVLFQGALDVRPGDLIRQAVS
jgi:hypothetical protein